MAQFARPEDIVREFTQQDFSHIVLNNTQPYLRYRNYFPLRFNPDLTFGNIERESDANIMASVVSLGSPAPKSGRTTASSVSSQIPKIEQARSLDEEGMFNLRSLRTAVSTQIEILRRNPVYNPDGTVSDITNRQIASLQATLIEEIYGDAIFVQNTINNRLEWMAKRLASTGIIELDKFTNSKGVQGLSLDFKVEKVDPNKDWDDADANPIEDLKALRRSALKKGYNLRFMITDSITADRMLALESVRKFVFGLPINPATGYTGHSPNLSQLNVALASQGLPVLQIWDSFLVEQNKAGENKSFSGWEEGRIMLTDDALLGDTRYTHSEEFSSVISGAVTARQLADNMILVQQWGEINPTTLSAKATAFAIPSLNNTKRKVILKAFNSN